MPLKRRKPRKRRAIFEITRPSNFPGARPRVLFLNSHGHVMGGFGGLEGDTEERLRDRMLEMYPDAREVPSGWTPKRSRHK